MPVEGELELVGRIPTASNATFLARIGGLDVVYKPIAGEKPLWDFPDGTLAHREVAAFLVSEALGWDVVPDTWLATGPLGEGMVQAWREPDPTQDAVALVPSDAIPADGWRHVFDGSDEYDRPVSLIHEDSAALRRMAVFDIVVNNADRKGAHILEMPDGHRHGVDHGLTFNEEHRLRTVLWGWMYEPLAEEELAAVAGLRSQLDEALGSILRAHLTADELEAFADRCGRLTAAGYFPAPAGDMPPMPWPLF